MNHNRVMHNNYKNRVNKFNLKSSSYKLLLINKINLA